MNRYHILGTFLTLLAWSSSYLPTTPQQAGRFQIGQAAQAEPRWTPNPDRGSASSTLSGGRRGESACAAGEQAYNPAISLLVPTGTAGLTTETQPTLSWLLESDQPADMEFVLSHPAQATPVYTRSITAEAGLVEVALPESAALEADTRYRWTVFLSCHDGESEVHARSFVERVASDVLAGDVSDLTELEQANVYAESGIWYDALNSLLQAYRADSKTSTLSEIHKLLEQANAEVPSEFSLATAPDISLGVSH